MLSQAEVDLASLAQVVQQGLRFGIIVVIATLSGLTLLGWLRVCVAPRVAVFLAPPVTLAAWSLMLGIGVGAGLPIKNFYVLGWAVTLGLAAYACRPTSLRSLKPDWRVVLVAIGAPIGVAAPYFRWGLTTFAGSPYLDGWSYAALGQYLWEYPRQTEGGLAPVYQYAAVLSHIRYIGSALMGFVSPLVGSAGDTQPAFGVVLVLALFALGCGCVVLAGSFGLGSWATLGLVALVVFSGWSVDLMTSNALDNGLALYALPVLVGVVRMADLKRTGWWLLMALFISALLYTYPELAWAALLAFGLVLVQRLIVLRIDPRVVLARAGSAAIVAGVLLTPFAATDLVEFFRSQAASAMRPAALRQGEGLFHELIQPTKVAWAIWGMTNETAICSRCALQLGSFVLDGRMLLAVALTGLAGLGFIVLVRRRELAVCVAVVTFLAAAGFLGLRLVYAYGAFKILIVGWPLVGLCIVLACATVDRAARSVGHGYWGRSAVGAVMALYALGVSTQVRAFGNSVPTTTFDTYRVVQAVPSIVGPEPVLVTVSNYIANGWAVYALRDSPIVLDTYEGYMAQPHVIPLMQRASPSFNSRIRYVLTDATPPATPDGFQAVWSQGPYELWRALDEGWALIGRVDAPNGVEQWPGGPGFWLGSEAADLEITATRSDQACLHAVLSPGPSIPDQPSRRVDVSVGETRVEVLQIANKQAEQLTVSLAPGLNHVRLIALDHPTLARVSASEDRTLLVGVEDLKLALGACPAT